MIKEKNEEWSMRLRKVYKENKFTKKRKNLEKSIAKSFRGFIKKYDIK